MTQQQCDYCHQLRPTTVLSLPTLPYDEESQVQEAQKREVCAECYGEIAVALEEYYDGLNAIRGGVHANNPSIATQTKDGKVTPGVFLPRKDK